MFQRGEPSPSDAHLGTVYGLALPFLKRGMPITPVQLENVILPNYLTGFRALLLTYQGMKPLDAAVHRALADWVKAGGLLVVVDDDTDPFNKVHEWWNTNGLGYTTPRVHLFEQLGLGQEMFKPDAKSVAVGKGSVVWLREKPVAFTADAEAAARLVKVVEAALPTIGGKWSEANHLLLKRGPYVIAAGLDETIAGDPLTLPGRFVNLFDPELKLNTQVTISPGSRYFLLDLNGVNGGEPKVLASACKALVKERTAAGLVLTVEGVEARLGSFWHMRPPGLLAVSHWRERLWKQPNIPPPTICSGSASRTRARPAS
jgi:hypothetical protein